MNIDKGTEPSLIGKLSHKCRCTMMRPRRYVNLFEKIYKSHCRSILEIGVYNGTRACQMIRTSNLFFPAKEIEYFGFDLFELLTPEDLEKELSKQPPAMNVVQKKVEAMGAKVKLYQGYTTDTLPDFVSKHKGNREFDFIFIDGGHSIASIEFDWNSVRQLMGENTLVIFDDYYRNSEPETAGFGCQTVIDDLDREKYMVEVLGPEDRFKKEWGSLNVSMASVRLRP